MEVEVAEKIKKEEGDRGLSCCNEGDDGRRGVVPDSAFTVFRARVNAHLARAPTALTTRTVFALFSHLQSVHTPVPEIVKVREKKSIQNTRPKPTFLHTASHWSHRHRDIFSLFFSFAFQLCKLLPSTFYFFFF